MSDPAVSVPEPQTPPPHRHYSDQDKEIEDGTAAASVTLQTIQTESEISAALATRGQDTGQIAAGAALLETTQAAILARQTAMSVQEAASTARDAAEVAARQKYAAVRKGIRDVFKTEAERTALAVNGEVPKDLLGFLSRANETYTAAQTAPYAAQLAANGYPAGYITAALGTLTTFQSDEVAQNLAIGAAEKATTDRNAAYAVLTAWIKKITHIAEDELSTRPDLLKKLNP